MQITFKKKHILFACTPLRLSNSLADFHLVSQLKQAFADYELPQPPPPPAPPIEDPLPDVEPQGPADPPNEGVEPQGPADPPTEGEGNPEPQPDPGNAPLTVTITPRRFIEIYKHVSAMPEGMTAAFSTEIMEYLTPQLEAGTQAGDPDWVEVAIAIKDERTQHQATFMAHTASNLAFLKNVNI